jgi:histidinol-phosphate phosphatase family protein
LSLPKNRAVFLDRDGTLNEDSTDYIKSTAEFRLFEFTPSALRLFQKLGFLIIIVSNQSAIGRGLMTRWTVDEINGVMKSILRENNISITDIYYCPHKPDDKCDCRKPGTENIKRAIAEYNIDIARSYFIGDSQKDIQAGAAVGCKSILVKSGVNPPSFCAIQNWDPRPNFVTDNILEAAQLVECLERSRDK